MAQAVPDKSHGDVIYKHARRPEWGMAVLAWQHDDKRAYQFEDGQVRIFKRDYFDLMKPVVDAPKIHRAARTLERLGSSDGANRATAAQTKGDALPISAQIALFRELYPDGFQGEVWQTDKRGVDAPTRLKRHRDPAIADTTKFFTRKNLTTLMKGGDDDQIVAEMVAVLRATDLVNKKHLDPLAELAPLRKARLVTTIFDALFSKKPFAIRFERWLTELEGALGKSPPWPVASALLALARPAKYICVHPPTLRRQAIEMAPKMAGERAVSALAYERWNAMADAVAHELEQAGLSPQDKFDIYDFMVETLRPKHKGKARSL